MKLLTTKRVDSVDLNWLYQSMVCLKKNRWKIKVVKAPPSTREIDYVPTNFNEYYKEIGFKEGWISCPLLRTNALTLFKQGNRKQYGLQHRDRNESFSYELYPVTYGNRNIINE